jgi:tetraacyldisaccharide 4'-kinase
MKLFKPKFWKSNKNFFTLLLIPLSLITWIYIILKKTFIQKVKFNIPVICVGNIFIGGTGKTPLSIHIARKLSENGKNPAIVRKYYKSHKDEHKMIISYYNKLILNLNRSKGIYEALEKGFDAVILDDGFQDYKIKKNLSIICFNSNQLIGNGYLFPSGPLRESLGSLRNANILIINGDRSLDFEQKILKIQKDLKIYYSNYKPLNIQEFENKKLLVISGIGNPENFFKILKDNQMNIQKKMVYPDHYEFTKNEMLKIIEYAKKNDFQIVMTEKDYYKIKDFSLENIKYLKVKLEIEKEEEFIKNVMKAYD